MAYQDYCPTSCPVGCAYTIPVAPTQTGCKELATDLVDGVYFWNPQTPLVADFTISNGTVNPAAVTEWTDRLSNTATDADSIRFLKVCKGVLTNDTPVYVEGVCGAKRIKSIKRRITFRDEDDSDANYEFHSKMNCLGGTIALVAKSGSKWFGSKTGIKANFTSVYKIEESGTSPTRFHEVTIEWEDTCAVPRTPAVV